MRRTVLCAAATLALAGCSTVPDPGSEPIDFAPVPSSVVSEPVASTTNAFDFTNEAGHGPFRQDAGINAFTMTYPDGTASWCFAYTKQGSDVPALHCTPATEET